MKGMSNDQRRRVAVIDDEDSVRRMLELALSQEGYDVRTAADGAVGLSLIRSWQPECIVLDVMMPKIDGLTLLPMIRRITEVPIIMLTARGDVRDRIDGIRAGADDYLAKPFDLEELTTRLDAALRRPRLREVHVLHYDDLSIDLETRMVRRGDVFVALTAREFDLLVVLARRPLRVFTRDELIHLVWGDERDTSTQTVDTYISYLRQKIDRDAEKSVDHDRARRRILVAMIRAMIRRRPSLLRRLTLFYTTLITIVLFISTSAIAFVTFENLTRAEALNLASTYREVRALVSNAPAQQPASDLQRAALRTAHLAGVQAVPIPLDLTRQPDGPPWDLSVGRIFGLSPLLIPARGSTIVVVPDPRRLTATLHLFIFTLVALFVTSLVIGWLVARIGARQTIKPILLVTAELRRFESGDFTPRSILATDLTEIGDLAAAYNGAARQVTDAFQERRRVEERIRQFVAEAGHELRTPLTVVAGYVDVLRRGGDEDAQVRAIAFESLRFELRRMRALVERLMTLARLDRPLDVKDEIIDVRAMVRQAVDAIAVTSEVPIRYTSDGDFFVRGEAGDVYEATANLLENAVKYGEGSDVDVALEKPWARRRRAGSRRRPGHRTGASGTHLRTFLSRNGAERDPRFRARTRHRGKGGGAPPRTRRAPRCAAEIDDVRTHRPGTSRRRPVPLARQRRHQSERRRREDLPQLIGIELRAETLERGRDHRLRDEREIAPEQQLRGIGQRE